MADWKMCFFAILQLKGSENGASRWFASAADSFWHLANSVVQKGHDRWRSFTKCTIWLFEKWHECCIWNGGYSHCLTSCRSVFAWAERFRVWVYNFAAWLAIPSKFCKKWYLLHGTAKMRPQKLVAIGMMRQQAFSKPWTCQEEAQGGLGKGSGSSWAARLST